MHPQTTKHQVVFECRSSSVGRAPAFQAGCREFEPRLLLKAFTKVEAFLFLGVYLRSVGWKPRVLRVALSITIFFRSSKRIFISIANANYFNPDNSLPDFTSYGLLCFVKILAVNSPRNTIESPLTLSQLPSRSPTTGTELNS